MDDDKTYHSLSDKMLSDPRFNNFVTDFAMKYIDNEDWREGQTLYNVYWEWFPELADQLRLSDANPYYDDSNVNAAWDFIIEHWE